MPAEDIPEIHNLKDFMSLLGQYDNTDLGEDGGFILSIFGTKKKGKTYIADFNTYVDRFSGYNPRKHHHLLYWLQDEAGDILRPGSSYVVTACVPDTLEPVAHTIIAIPKEEAQQYAGRQAPGAAEEENMLRGLYKSLQEVVVKKMAEGFENAFDATSRPKTVGATSVHEIEEEDDDMSDQLIELDNGALLPQKKAIEILLRNQMNNANREPDREKESSGGLPSILNLLTTLGPQLQPILGGLLKNLLQGPQPPQIPAPTVGGYPGYPSNGTPNYPPPQYPLQGQYPFQTPQAPPPAPAPQAPVPQTPPNPLGGLDLGAIGAQLGIPGIENLLSQLMGNGNMPSTANPSFSPPAAPAQQADKSEPSMTSAPSIPGMAEDPDTYEDDEYEEYDEEEEDMLGAEGKELAKALYNVIYPIYRKKADKDPIGALKEIQEEGTKVFKEVGADLFTLDILEDWCAEAAEAVAKNTPSESAKALFESLPFVNRTKIKLAGSAAVTTVISTMTNIMAGLDGEFSEDEDLIT